VIIQFGYKKHTPPKGAGVVDCRVIPNPWLASRSDRTLRKLVEADPQFPGLVEKAIKLLTKNGTVYIGCLYGKHRSGAVAQEVSRRTGVAIELRPAPHEGVPR